MSSVTRSAHSAISVSMPSALIRSLSPPARLCAEQAGLTCPAGRRCAIACVWADQRHDTPTTVQSSSRVSSPYSSTGSTIATTLTSKVPELKLLHFWVVNTACTVARKDQHYLYTNVLVELGFKHHYLLDGILAVAAIHKAVTFPTGRPELMLQSSVHYDAAISEYMKLMENPDPSTCLPVCALSVVLHMHYYAIAQINPPKDPIAEICSWSTLLRGIRETIVQNYHRLQRSEIGPLLETGRDDNVDTSQPTEVLRLQKLVEDVSDAAQHEIYKQAVDSLHEIYLNVRSTSGPEDSPVLSMTLSWTATVPPGFLELLLAREQVALVILAYYAVLLVPHDRSWWMRGWTRWTMDAVHRELREPYLVWTEWPRAQVESMEAL